MKVIKKGRRPVRGVVSGSRDWARALGRSAVTTQTG